MGQRAYHHGDLRRVLLDAALSEIERDGPATLSLRGLARQAGVSHAAPAHHFGDKAGLLTAIATEGYRRMAAELGETFARTNSFLEVGVAYVGFAVDHRGHFAVMFRPDLLRGGDPELRSAMAASTAALYGPVGSVALGPTGDARRAAVAGWALVHGLATLYLHGNLPSELGDDPRTIARELASYLFGGRPPTA